MNAKPRGDTKEKSLAIKPAGVAISHPVPVSPIGHCTLTDALRPVKCQRSAFPLVSTLHPYFMEQKLLDICTKFEIQQMSSLVINNCSEKLELREPHWMI
ncbi:Aldo-Keto Reductase Family 1 Member C1 [Manis pentadactyla]|nr:Aldo-Keto Reductase Family 1 Member C1 [Manis pentadactyla]